MRTPLEIGLALPGLLPDGYTPVAPWQIPHIHPLTMTLLGFHGSAEENIEGEALCTVGRPLSYTPAILGSCGLAKHVSMNFHVHKHAYEQESLFL